MIALKREPGIFFLLLLLLFYSLDVQSPIAFYGTQFIGLSALVIYRFFVYPQLSPSCLRLLIFVVIFLEILCLIQYTYINESILVLVYQKVVFLLSVAILLYDYLAKVNTHTLKKAIALFISALSLVVLLQFVGFYFLNLDRSVLDFGILLGGEQSRTWYSGDWIYRPTGVTSEPAIFVGVQFGLLALQYVIDKEAVYSRAIGIISLCLSMSFLGLLLAVIFLMVVYSKNIKNYIFGAIALCAFYFYSFDLINDRISRLNSGDDGSNNVKVEAFQFFTSSPEIILLGYGHLFPSENSPQFYDALGDLTFYINMFTIYGLLLGGLILFVFFRYLIKSGTTIKEKVVILMALIKLSNPSVLFFSCFFLLLISFINMRKKLR
ncbi:hypothetical protein EC844_11846 [Acinetobacter calcoaceticus]|uniref:Uncharacterized protein n=1 Tax=Acinetobacter calcoaceticus TaxID=471 RepID=A0A4R1XQ11_ACICA|nr:hypothetical protein EC844_11846 [Acinetobacter calcoaceticus]